MLGSTGSLKYVGLGGDSSDPMSYKGRSKSRANNFSTLSLTSIGMDTSDFLSKGLDSPVMERSNRFNRYPEGQSGSGKNDLDIRKKSDDSSSLWKWSSPTPERKNSPFRSPITIDPPYESTSTIGSPSLLRKASWGSSAPQSPYPNRKFSWETTSSYRSCSPNRKTSWDSSPPRSPSPNHRKPSWGSPSRSPSTSRKSSYGSPPPRTDSPTPKAWESWSESHNKSSDKSGLRKTSPPTLGTSSPFTPRR